MKINYKNIIRNVVYLYFKSKLNTEIKISTLMHPLIIQKLSLSIAMHQPRKILIGNCKYYYQIDYVKLT